MTKQMADSLLAKAALEASAKFDFDESLMHDEGFIKLMQKVKAALDADGIKYYSRF